MSEPSLLQDLMDEPGAPLTNWREIIKAINDEFPAAKTEQHRVALLTVFRSTMDIAEKTVAAEDLAKFQEARGQNYSSFLVEEALIGEHVCVETMYAITQREIDAGRMTPDDNLRKGAEAGMAAPHNSRAELIKIAARTGAKPSIGRRILGWLGL